jgi:hypothetical protein
VKLYARLPRNRWAEGSIWLIGDDGRLMLGPDRCRGKADNAAAKRHGNPDRDPTLPYGDHACGVYRITAVLRNAGARFGPVFFRLEPISGDALLAAKNGRTGLAVHGGPLVKDGGLRATNGCNRILDAFALALAEPIEHELQAGREVLYEAVE